MKPNQIKRIQQLYQRRVRPGQMISPELARSLCELSQETGRQLGLLLDRKGYVDWVVVGNAHRLLLPDVGRLRGGRTHFRGLRLVHTHLRCEPLTRDDLADLALLRLDYVAAIQVADKGLPGRVLGAHLLPGDLSPTPWRIEEFDTPHALTDDFLDMISELEAEFTQKVATPSLTQGEKRGVLVAVAPRTHLGEEALQELAELARTAGLGVASTVIQVRPHPDARYVVGKGRLEDLVVETMQQGAEVIVFANNLTPNQARSIADFTELKVLDRTQLILDIFAHRALSRDGKLQVELAQLKYRMPRLTAEDSGLSRLTGGIGGQGPGETKLEIDRRRARERIQRLEKEIEKLSLRRAVRRQKRAARQIPIVSIVGYTNAGKSTLLNRLTNSSVFVEDKLFATLDPTSRRLRFPRNREIIITDTVGFIRDLPPDLMTAFRATLEELKHADLLLHVVDAADPRLEDQIQVVVSILEKLDLGQIPRLLLLNKIDLIPTFQAKALARRTGGILISASQKLGLDELLDDAQDILWSQGRSPLGS